MKKVTVIGGGTGTFVVLSGLKKEQQLDLGVIVTMMDSGGSTGRLRDQLGVLPPGDLRQCLVALSEAPELWRKLFLYRFEHGDLKGHNFGNIFLSALEKVSESYDEVMDTAEFVLKTKGEIFPVTYEKANLCAKYESGAVVCGEGNIDENNDESRIEQAYLDPQVKANQKAMDRIQSSDYIVIGPGDLYTSIIPVFLVDGVKQAIEQSSAKVIFNLNLMTKMGQTSNYTASDHVQDLTKYIGREPDYVVVNNGSIAENILEWYNKHNEQVVENNLMADNFHGNIIQADLIDRQQFTKNTADVLTRSILRHDSELLAKTLSEIIL